MEKKNSTGIIIVLMGIIIIILSVLCILFATDKITFNKQNNNNVENQNNSTDNTNENQKKTNTNYCEQIIGNYRFDEAIANAGDINGITAASYEYKLAITNDQNNCNASLEITGIQIYNIIKLDVVYTNNQYNFLFNTYAESDVPNTGSAGIYNKGDILFTLYNNNDNLYTHWEKYDPFDKTNKEDGIYFEKK